MEFGQPKFSKEEQEKLGSQAISDAALIGGGAEYDESGILQPTETQKERIGFEGKEGVVENLATYIRLNKKILVPINELRGIQISGRPYPEVFSKGMASVECKHRVGGNSEENIANVFFIDVDQNFAQVDILSQDVAELQHIHIDVFKKVMMDKLKRLGFTNSNWNIEWATLFEQVEKYHNIIEQIEANKKRTEFDF